MTCGNDTSCVYKHTPLESFGRFTVCSFRSTSSFGNARRRHQSTVVGTFVGYFTREILIFLAALFAFFISNRAALVSAILQPAPTCFFFSSYLLLDILSACPLEVLLHSRIQRTRYTGASMVCSKLIQTCYLNWNFPIGNIFPSNL